MKRRLLVLAIVAATAIAAAGLAGGRAEAQVGPIAQPGGPYAGVVGLPIQFNGSASFGVTPLTFQWNFGDGGVGFGPVVTHAFGAPGIFTVTLTVMDQFGQVSAASTTATVSFSTFVTGTVVPGAPVATTCAQVGARIRCSDVPTTVPVPTVPTISVFPFTTVLPFPFGFTTACLSPFGVSPFGVNPLFPFCQLVILH